MMIGIKSKQISGLTLIEMMLVITVFAIASLSVLKIIKSRATTQIVDSVVTQMQNTSEAALNYYMINSAKAGSFIQNGSQPAWPTTSSTPTSLQTSLAGSGYIPVEVLCTPFPGNGTGNCSNQAEIEGQLNDNASYYTLVLTTNSVAAAKAIASNLANATANGTTVFMNIVAPTANIYWNKNHGWIATAGVVSTTPTWGGTNLSAHTAAATSMYISNCPNGFEPHLIFAPFRYQTAGSLSSQWSIHIGQSISGGENDYTGSDPSGMTRQNSIVFPVTTSDGVSAYAVNISDAYDSTSQTIGHLTYFLSICLPVGHWAINGIQPQTGLHANGVYSQDGQCSSSWEDLIVMSSPHYVTNTCSYLGFFATIYNAGGAETTIFGNPDAY